MNHRSQYEYAHDRIKFWVGVGMAAIGSYFGISLFLFLFSLAEKI